MIIVIINIHIIIIILQISGPDGLLGLHVIQTEPKSDQGLSVKELCYKPKYLTARVNTKFQLNPITSKTTIVKKICLISSILYIYHLNFNIKYLFYTLECDQNETSREYFVKYI